MDKPVKSDERKEYFDSYLDYNKTLRTWFVTDLSPGISSGMR